MVGKKAEAKNDQMPWWFYVLFIGIGLTLTVVAFIWGNSVSHFVKSAIEAEGVFIEYGEKWDSDSGNYLYYPVYEFVTREGETRRFRSSVGSSGQPRKAGDKATILYNPDDPRDAEIKSFFTLWMGPLIVGFIGPVFFVLGIVLFYNMRLRKKPKR